MMPKVAAICVGEMHFRVGIADIKTKEMKIIYEAPTNKTDLLSQIFSEVDKLKDYEGIGIAFPGLLHAGKGVVHKARNLGVKDLRIVDILEKRYKVPTYLSDLSTASVLGEKLFGVGRDYKDIVYLIISAGIECGVIMDNRVVLGKDGNAHEIGHTVIDASSDVVCGCGRRGHWEAFCSASGIPEFTKYLLETKYSDQHSVLRKMEALNELNAHEIFALAKEDKVARGITKEIGRYNTIGIANIIEIYDPELIAIGGSVIRSDWRAVLNPVLSGIEKYVVRLNRMPKIIPTPLGNKAVLYGAVADFL